jgi:hypothetical protein
MCACEADATRFLFVFELLCSLPLQGLLFFALPRACLVAVQDDISHAQEDAPSLTFLFLSCCVCMSLPVPSNCQ